MAVVEDLLGKSCAVEEVAEETASRRDMSSFKLRAWTSDLSSIPVARTLVVPEPPASNAAARVVRGSLRGGAPARKEPELPALKYKILVHVTKVEQLVCDAAVTRGGAGPGDGQGGDGGGSGGGGRRWVSYPQPWRKGAPDHRGSSVRGAHRESAQGQGSRTAMAWQLPRLPRPGPIAVQIASDSPESELPVSEAEKDSADKAAGPDLSVLEPIGSGSDVAEETATPVVLGERVVSSGAVDPADGERSTIRQVWESERTASLPVSASDPEVLGDKDCTHAGGEPILDCSVENLGVQTGSESTKESGDQGERNEMAGAREQENDSGTVLGSASGLGHTLAQDQERQGDAWHASQPLAEESRDLRMVLVTQNAEVHTSPQLEDLTALIKIKTFCAKILKTLAPPLLKEIEVARKLVEVEPCTPRRVTRRLGASSVVSCDKPLKKASAAETVLLKALGITPSDLAVNDEDLRSFKELFDSPLREAHLRAVAAIFGKIMPPNFEQAKAGRLELEAH
jgi:hypothetical protein